MDDLPEKLYNKCVEAIIQKFGKGFGFGTIRAPFEIKGYYGVWIKERKLSELYAVVTLWGLSGNNNCRYISVGHYLDDDAEYRWISEPSPSSKMILQLLV